MPAKNSHNSRRVAKVRLGGWIAAAGFAVFAAMVADGALAATSIKDSKHNLGTTGTSTVRVTTGTDEVCVFCHTPHGGDTTRSAPLWNRTAGGTGFAVYDGLWGDRPSSFDGAAESEASRAVGSISALCLSCHDGATALDLLINAPGSGGYNAAGASAGYTWNMGGNVMPAGITNLGPDLKNDHPIGIPYCGGKAAGTSPIPITNCRDQDFVVPATAGGLFWVDSKTAGGADIGTPGTREKTDMILYVRTFSASGSWPAVECGSCHDPHNADSYSSTDPKSVAFLRIKNTGSQLCLSCHVK
jgi:nitrate/TMAO reductase-like tetraheme cytochrome c subunit